MVGSREVQRFIKSQSDDTRWHTRGIITDLERDIAQRGGRRARRIFALNRVPFPFRDPKEEIRVGRKISLQLAVIPFAPRETLPAARRYSSCQRIQRYAHERLNPAAGAGAHADARVTRALGRAEIFTDARTHERGYNVRARD